MEPLPDLATLTDDDLRTMIRTLEKEEDDISFQRRVLHGRIDILRAELVARLQRAGERGRGTAQVGRRAPRREILQCEGRSDGRRVSHVYCPECGFPNPEAANSMTRCGAMLVKDGGARARPRSRFTPEDEEDATSTGSRTWA